MLRTGCREHSDSRQSNPQSHMGIQRYGRRLSYLQSNERRPAHNSSLSDAIVTIPLIIETLPLSYLAIDTSHAGVAKAEGKLHHMASAAEFIQATKEVKITRATTLLIDDNKSNVEISLANNVRALRFYPNQPNK